MSRYIIYTYQFTPLQAPGKGLFDCDRSLTPDQLMARKQDIFGRIISGATLSFEYKNRIYEHKMLMQAMGIVIFRLANNRNAVLERDFKKDVIDYAPSCNVIIDNRRNIQCVAIEDDTTAFYDTVQVVKILQATFNRQLLLYGLRINIQRVYRKTEFWNIVKAYGNGVEMVRFRFSYPNLPRVNKTVKEILASTSKSTNSKQSLLELKSASGEILRLEESNRELKDLVDCAAESGDEIEIRARGIKGIIKTGSTTVSVEIGNLDTILSKDLFQEGAEKIIGIINKVIKP